MGGACSAASKNLAQPHTLPLVGLDQNKKEIHMLRYALLFLIIALIAGMFGFTTVAGTAYLAAKVLFFVFLVLFVLMLLLGARATRNLVD
jgi:uncharacterized membrane protein YtjA (UPF0391 family)